MEELTAVLSEKVRVLLITRTGQLNIQDISRSSGIFHSPTHVHLTDRQKGCLSNNACAFCAEESDKPVRLQCGHALCQSCSQTKATVSHPHFANNCPVCIEIPSYTFQPQSVPLQSQSPNIQPRGPTPSIPYRGPPSNILYRGPPSNIPPLGPPSNILYRGPLPNLPPRGPTQNVPPRGPSPNNLPRGPSTNIQPRGPSPIIPAQIQATDSAVLYGVPHKRPQLLIWPGQVGNTSQPPLFAEQRAPIQRQVTPPVIRQLYPLERLAQMENDIPQQNSPPPLPDRPLTSPLTTPVTSPLTTDATSPLEPSAPPKEEIYDDGYDSIINIPDRLEGEDFYCGEISRDESTDILKKNGTDGYFLVRKTVKDDPSHIYTIDILYGQTDYHLKIKRRPDGRYYVKNDAIIPKHFEDVRSLIQHFKGKSVVMADRKTGQEFKLTLQS